jgi:hypothetical protein
MNYQQIAAGVYQRCNHFDPYLPPLSADLARAWGSLFAKHRLSQDDLLAAVDTVYDTHGGGYRPMPADIAATARAIRQDRYDRSDIHQRGAYEAIGDAKASAHLTALVTQLADRKTIPDEPREFVRRSHGELPTPLSVPCPYCHVGPGRWCVAQSTGQPMRHGSGYHPGRADAAAAARKLPPEVSSAIPLCQVCGAHPLLAIHETKRGICDWCEPATNGHQPRNGDKGTTTA